jgi:hypothetical protein
VFPCPCCSRHIFLSWPDNIEIIGEASQTLAVQKFILKCAILGARADSTRRNPSFSGKAGGWARRTP